MKTTNQLSNSNYLNNTNSNVFPQTNINSYSATARKYSPLNNQIQNTNQNNISQTSYYFKERKGQLKWKEIMKIDIDLLIKQNNISQLEPLLDNLIFSNIEENDLSIVCEENILKLLKMFQHVIEYLIHTQQKLENEIVDIEKSYLQIMNETQEKEEVLKKNKETIYLLKKEVKEKEAVLASYKYLINDIREKYTVDMNQKQQNMIKEILNKEKYDSVEGNEYGRRGRQKGVDYYICHFCGKAFIGNNYLQKHLRKRHDELLSLKTNTNYEEKNHHPHSKPHPHHKLNSIDDNQPKEEMENKESKINNEKISLIDMKLNSLTDNFEKYMKSLSDPIEKFSTTQKEIEKKIGQVKEETKAEMEMHLKDVLQEIKSIYINSIDKSRNERIEDNQQKLEIERVTKTLFQMEEMIKEMKKENLSKSIHNDKKNLCLSHENNIVFTNVPKVKNFHNVKVYNSGPLEDDNSDEEKFQKEEKTEFSILNTPKTLIKKETNLINMRIESVEIEIQKNIKKEEVSKLEDIKINNSNQETPSIKRLDEEVLTSSIQKDIKKEQPKIRSVSIKEEKKEIKQEKKEEKAEKEEIKDKVIKKIDPHTKDQAYNQLKEEFNFYMARDLNFHEQTNKGSKIGLINKYRSISKDKQKSKEKYNQTLEQIINKETEKLTMNNSKALNEILTKEKNIPLLIDTLMKDIDEMKNEDGYFSHYYENIEHILGLGIEEKLKETNKLSSFGNSFGVNNQVKGYNTYSNNEFNNITKKIEKLNEENNLISSSKQRFEDKKKIELDDEF